MSFLRSFVGGGTTPINYMHIFYRSLLNMKMYRSKCFPCGIYPSWDGHSASIYIYIYIYICKRRCVCVCVCVCVLARVYVYMHVNAIHTHTHTHIYIYIYIYTSRIPVPGRGYTKWGILNFIRIG